MLAVDATQRSDKVQTEFLHDVKLKVLNFRAPSPPTKVFFAQAL